MNLRLLLDGGVCGAEEDLVEVAGGEGDVPEGVHHHGPPSPLLLHQAGLEGMGHRPLDLDEVEVVGPRLTGGPLAAAGPVAGLDHRDGVDHQARPLGGPGYPAGCLLLGPADSLGLTELDAELRQSQVHCSPEHIVSLLLLDRHLREQSHRGAIFLRLLLGEYFWKDDFSICVRKFFQISPRKNVFLTVNIIISWPTFKWTSKRNGLAANLC